jgi:hypothetical protein
MPFKKRRAPGVAKRTYLRHGYEKIIAGILLRDGWQVFLPLLDDSHATDIIFSDGSRYFRLQVKTTERKKMSGRLRIPTITAFAPVNYIIVVSVTSDWGFVIPRAAAGAKSISLPVPLKYRFQWQKPRSIIKAFNAA